MAHVAGLRELSKGTPEGVTYLRNNWALANNLRGERVHTRKP